MVELFIRTAAVSTALLCAGLNLIPAGVAAQSAVGFVAVGLLGAWFDRRGGRNSGFAGLLAVADAFALASLLGGFSALHQLGFLVIAPCALAGARYGAAMISMAPLAATALVASTMLGSADGLPQRAVLIHAAGVLAISLLLGQRRTVFVEVPAAERAPVPAPQVIEDGFLQLRENFRKLRDAYRELERKARRDRILARVSQAGIHRGRRFYAELCDAVREVTGASELAIYTLSQADGLMIVRGMTDRFPSELADEAVRVDLRETAARLCEHAREAIASLSREPAISNVLLIHQGRMIGMICAADPHPSKAEQVRKALEEAASAVAERIDAEMAREAGARRIAELEVLYNLASAACGAATPSILGARIARELSDALDLDEIEIGLLDVDGLSVLCAHGARSALHECLQFPGGSGVAGWRRAGSPEVLLIDARSSGICESSEALRRRVGSYALLPLAIGGSVAGYVAASTRMVGGLDGERMATLRMSAAEFSRALERLQRFLSGGLMTPREFAAATGDQAGCLVYIEPLRRDQVVEAYGSATFEAAVRELGNQVRAQLPPGGCLCRRDENDLIAFLPQAESEAREWAIGITASAALIPVGRDRTDKLPLAIRARVAQLSPQTHELSAQNAA